MATQRTNVEIETARFVIAAEDNVVQVVGNDPARQYLKITWLLGDTFIGGAAVAELTGLRINSDNRELELQFPASTAAVYALVSFGSGGIYLLTATEV